MSSPFSHDLTEVGTDIFNALNKPRKTRPAFNGIISDKLYGPTEVGEILSVSYNTALRTMERMRRTANLAQPRARKRLLRVKGSDLRDYLNGKIG